MLTKEELPYCPVAVTVRVIGNNGNFCSYEICFPLRKDSPNLKKE